MDLSFIKEQLETFSTFAGAIGDFLQLPAKILGDIFGWFGDGFGENNDTFENDWADTSSFLGSSNDSEPAAGAGEGLSSNGDDNAEAGLSSKADDAE